MEASSKVWFTRAGKDKLAAGFTVSGAYSGDKLSTLQQFMLFAGQHSMLWASQGIMPGFNTSKGSIEDLNRVGSYSGLMVQANLDQGRKASRRTTSRRPGPSARASPRWRSGSQPEHSASAGDQHLAQIKPACGLKRKTAKSTLPFLIANPIQ